MYRMWQFIKLFRIKTMFGSSLSPVVWRIVHVLFTLFVFALRLGVSNTCCVRLVYPMLPVSLDWPFFIIPFDILMLPVSLDWPFFIIPFDIF